MPETDTTTTVCAGRVQSNETQAERPTDARRLPKWRNALRNRLIPIVRWETPWLACMQDNMRSPALDTYFAYTANLGTHTFFMIFLPIQFWCGYTSLGRAYVKHLSAKPRA